MKKFRGQHRYYRRLKVGTPAVHRKMDEWIHYLKNGQSQYDYDHIHFDCPKQPLFRWNAIKQHLDAMMCSFQCHRNEEQSCLLYTSDAADD